MEEVNQIVEQANELLKRADHMASVTYQVVNETKLLVVIVDNLYQAAIKAMDAVLHYDYLYKRIGELPANTRERMNFFRETAARRYNIPREQILALYELYDLVEKHKKSPMEFVRKETYVIASTDYKLRLLDLKKVKQYVEATKMFIRKVNSIVGARDRRSSHF